MAEHHYDVNVEVIQIEPQREVEAALFNDNCDAIIEHIEYLHSDAARDRKITFFCAPQIHRGLKLVVVCNPGGTDEDRQPFAKIIDIGRPLILKTNISWCKDRRRKRLKLVIRRRGEPHLHTHLSFSA